MIEMEPSQANFDAAVAHYRADRMEAADAICREILVGQPGHRDALRMQAWIALRGGRLGPAVDCLTRAARASGDDAEVLNELGFALLQSNRLEEALRTFERVVAIIPDVPEAHYYLGLVNRRLNRLDEAVAAYSRAVELRPDFADALLNLGVALQSQRRLEEALRFYKRALALMPSCARFIALNLASTGQGMLWLRPDGLQRYLDSLVDDERSQTAGTPPPGS